MLLPSQQPNENFSELLNSYSSTLLTKDNRAVGKWNYLENFFKKFNKVQLDKVALENEKKRLIEENQNLQTILKEYLNGISVNNEVLSKPNTLMMVNGKISTAIKGIVHCTLKLISQLLRKQSRKWRRSFLHQPHPLEG